MIKKDPNVYFYISEALKRKIIGELRDYWSNHPRYPDLVDNIQGKYAFTERPQYGIIVKVSSANKVQFSADNFIGTVQSYVTSATLPGYQGTSIEWVREDSLAIQANEGIFPSPPGIYYCEMTGDNQFHIDPLLDVADERVMMVSSTEGSLERVPYQDSLRLYELPSSRPLHHGTDYTVASDGQTIHLVVPLETGLSISADYRYPGVSTGPWDVKPQTGYNKPIPGVVMVFGRRYFKGDRFAVLVSRTREDAYHEYGGKWSMSVDLEVIARDVNAQMELADQTLMFLWATSRSRLIDQGIDIQDVSLGGETEEVYDENADDYFYNASISVSVETDWSLQVPLVPKLLGFEESLSTLPPDLALVPLRDPFFATRYTHEMVL